MKRKLSTTILCHILLTMITMLLLFLPLKAGMFFGSEGDWYAQHIGIAESLRQTMIEAGTVIPQYIHLGGGSSIYDFSYYGLLRPDILFACLVPKMEMRYIIAGYAVMGVTASVNLCYFWMKKHKISNEFAFAGAIVFAASTCFYHAHHQIMFVNYMTFLLIALIGVDRLLNKRRSVLLVYSLFMVYIHSFYYAISGLFAIGIYTVHQILQREEIQKKVEKGEWKQAAAIAGRWIGRLIFAIAVSIGMAMVLLLPTGLDILSNEKDAGSFVTVPVKLVDWSLKGLLYSPYGCGMTLITLYCLLLSMTKKRKRFLSVTLMLCVLLPVVSYVLNGFLYSRAKILIPLTALFVFVLADTLQDLCHGKQKYYFIPLLCCLVPFFSSLWRPLIIIDGMILCIWVLFQRVNRISQKMKYCTFWLILLVPVLVSLGVNMSDSYLKSICSQWGIATGGDYLKAEDDRQNHFISEEIADFVTDSRYRFDVLANNFVNCNLLADGEIQKTAMYSSVTNTEYARFYYDTMHNPISLNNRVALVPSENPYFSYFMGLKYLLTDKENLPFGYREVIEKNGYILAQNDDVLPVCYGTTELFSEDDYERLEFPYTLEMLCSKAVVPMDILEKKEDAASFHIQRERIEGFFVGNGEKKLLNPSGEKDCYKLQLVKPIKKKIFIISFHVESNDGKEVIISINGIKNKLSSQSAPYPNNNYDFTYILSAGESLEELEVEVSKGKYTVGNINIYTADIESFHHSDIVVPEIENGISKHGTSVFRGRITMEQAGYFITSYPYRTGYKVKVDDILTDIEKVNTAFVGFPIAAGKHQIEITYEAPGFRLGYIISLISFIFSGLAIVWERKIQGKKYRCTR